MGDYCCGPNHVLPTYGYAKAYSGLSLEDFQKRITVQELTPAGLQARAERRRSWRDSRDWTRTPRRSTAALARARRSAAA